MLRKIVEGSVRNRVLAGILLVIALLAGAQAMRTIALDAIPDLSDVQVVVFTEYPGQSPQIVEDQVTYPLTSIMLSVPKAKVVRGYSFFGYSFVYIIFEDGTDMYWARTRVLEYLNYVADQLPEQVNPALGPDATGVGWIYEYTLQSDRHDLQQLRSIQDWQIRYDLQQVKGVAEVAAIGGFVRQYQVTVDPQKLQAYNLSVGEVRKAVQRNNRDVGGRVVELAETEFMVRGLGYVESLDDLRRIPLGVDENHIPIRLQDVANVGVGPDIRRGLVDWNGEGEVVGGIVISRFGANTYEVLQNVKKQIAEIEKSLPEGVEIVPAYDRSGLIERSVDTLREKIVLQCIIVALVCMVFLFHLRSALVVILTLPGGILLAFLIMNLQGITADIMSLGGIAIAIGAMVDAAIVMVENMHKHLARAGPNPNRWEVAIAAGKEVGPAVFFSLTIIAVSFLPILALQGQEGRLFRPLAFTTNYAMLGAAVLSITMVPILMGALVRGKIRSERQNPIARGLVSAYRPLLRVAFRRPIVFIGVALALLGASVWPARQLGSEFMPPINEGDLLYMPSMLPGISVTAAKQVLQQTDRMIKEVPEVDRVFGKVGRAETATDPAPLSMIETVISLKPKDEWRPGMTVDKLVKELDHKVRLPGVTNAWTMPIKTRIDMLSTGIKTPVGIKILGPDLNVIGDIGERLEGVIGSVPGTASVYAERVTGGNFLDIEIDREAIARYGIAIDDVQQVIISSIGGMNVSHTVEGLERYPINVRYPRELRESLDGLKSILVYSPMGHHVPLGQLANLRFVKGPPVVKTEGARPTGWVYVDVTESDIGGYVERAQRAVEEQVELPTGYRLMWSGQFEYMQRAAKRLQTIIPVTLLGVFLLLFLNFRSLTESVLVMGVLPFALIGGVWMLWALDYELSVAVSVGFIALAGVAAETGVVMLVYLQRTAESVPAGERTAARLRSTMLEGASSRVRPLMMTVMSTICGLLPIMWATETGASVTKRIAAPMIGGLVTTILVTLFVVPLVYSWVMRRRWAKQMPGDAAQTE